MTTKNKPAKGAKKFDPTVGGWKRNRTGEIPVESNVLVECRRRDGEFTITMRAVNCRWQKFGDGRDIIWWRKARKLRAGKWSKAARKSHEALMGEHAHIVVDPVTVTTQPPNPNQHDSSPDLLALMDTPLEFMHPPSRGTFWLSVTVVAVAVGAGLWVWLA